MGVDSMNWFWKQASDLTMQCEGKEGEETFMYTAYKGENNTNYLSVLFGVKQHVMMSFGALSLMREV